MLLQVRAGLAMKTAGSRFLNKSELRPLFLSLSAFGACNAPFPSRKQGCHSPCPPSLLLCLCSRSSHTLARAPRDLLFFSPLLCGAMASSPRTGVEDAAPGCLIQREGRVVLGLVCRGLINKAVHIPACWLRSSLWEPREHHSWPPAWDKSLGITYEGFFCTATNAIVL